MKRLLTAFLLLLFFRNIVVSADVVFEATDADEKTSHGTIARLDAENLVMNGANGEISISLPRLETLQSRQSNPFSPPDVPSRESLTVGIPRNPQIILGRPGYTETKPNNEDSDVSENKTAAFPDSVIVIELLDGSRLVATSLTAKGKTARCRLVEGLELTLAFDLLDSIRFDVKNQNEVFDPPGHWQKLATAQGRPGDRLIVGRGETLDGYDGVVLEIAPETVSFSVDGETLPVPRRRVYGILFHTVNVAAMPSAAAAGRLTLWTGSRISFRSANFSPEDQRIHWISISGLEGSSALTEIDQMVFGQKEVVYLADMKPQQIRQSLSFDWEKKSAAADSPLEMLRTFRANRMPVGKQENEALSSLFDIISPKNQPGDSKSKIANQPIPGLHGISLDGRTYQRGLTVPVGTTLLYTLPGRFTALRGVAGIDDRIRPNGRVRLIIQADETLLTDMEIRGDQSARSLKFELPENVRTLRITVDFLSGFADSAPLNLADIKLLQ